MRLLDFLGFLVFVLLIALLGAPLMLAVLYPDSGAHIATISTTLIPWLSIVILFLVFNEGVKQFFSSIAYAVTRIKRLSAGSAVTEFEVGQRSGVTLTNEQIAEVRNTINRLQKEKSLGSETAWLYYLKYVAATVFRSQIELLRELDRRGPLGADELIRFYQLFLTRTPAGTKYEFTSYMQYLTSNLLIQLLPNTGKYEITATGKHFLLKLDEYGIKLDTFNY